MGKKKWVLPVAITLAFLVMAATGFLMGSDRPKVADEMLKNALKHADAEQDRDARKLRLPHIAHAGSEPSSGTE